MKQKISFRRLFASLRNVLTSPVLYRVVRLGLAILFIYAGVTKLLDPKAFARIISAYGIVPETLLPVVAVGLPLLETLAGIALLLDIRGSLAVISGLLGLFISILGFGILKDLNVDCGCFGTEELAQQDSLRQAFYRDLALIGIIVPYLYLSRWTRQYSRNNRFFHEEVEPREKGKYAPYLSFTRRAYPRPDRGRESRVLKDLDSGSNPE
jgi:uncharacterized membrane protein YphA (DoxX/SURF4 family)